jgi:uncharacterized phage-associated protein
MSIRDSIHNDLEDDAYIRLESSMLAFGNSMQHALDDDAHLILESLWSHTRNLTHNALENEAHTHYNPFEVWH